MVLVNSICTGIRTEKSIDLIADAEGHKRCIGKPTKNVIDRFLITSDNVGMIKRLALQILRQPQAVGVDRIQRNHKPNTELRIIGVRNI